MEETRFAVGAGSSEGRWPGDTRLCAARRWGIGKFHASMQMMSLELRLVLRLVRFVPEA